MKQPNQIILNDSVHIFVQDKPKVDNCNKCSLQEICYSKIKDGFLCSIFTDEEKGVINGHFKLKENK